VVTVPDRSGWNWAVTGLATGPCERVADTMECSNYTGDAHTRCLEAFVETQRDQIAALQGKMQAQQDTVNHLKDQLDRQASTNAYLQRRLAQPPTVVQTAPPSTPLPPWGLASTLEAPGSMGRHYFTALYLRPSFFYGSHHRGHRW